MTNTRKLSPKKSSGYYPKRKKKVIFTHREWKSIKRNRVQQLKLLYDALCYNHYSEKAPPFSFPAFQYIYFVHNPSEAIKWLLIFKEKSTKECSILYQRLFRKIYTTKTPRRCKGNYLVLKGSFLRHLQGQIHTLYLDLLGRKVGKLPEWSEFVRFILKATGGSRYFIAMKEYGDWFQH